MNGADRDIAEISVTRLAYVSIADSHEEASAKLDPIRALYAKAGMGDLIGGKN